MRSDRERIKKRKKKKKKIRAPIVAIARTTPKARETKFIRVMEEWETVHMTYDHHDGAWHEYIYIVSPHERVYRYAFNWEKPTLVIDSDILPPAHHIRLVRVTDKALRRTVLKALRRKHRLQGR